MTSHPSDLKKAVIFTVDGGWLAYALLSARRIIEISKPRDFDVIIASLEPLTIPDDFAQIGIRNDVLDLREEMARQNLPQVWLPLTAYLRLWIPDVYQKQYDRILYLDADTYLYNSNLSRLFEVDMGPHAVAAALDKEHFWQGEKPVLDFENLGRPVNRYFNSGMFLADTRAFTDQDLLSKMLDINHSGIHLLQHDQSLLNLAVNGAFAELSPRWNWQMQNRFPAYTRFVRPCLLHFSSNPRPWQAYEEETRYPNWIITEYSDFLSRTDPNYKAPIHRCPQREPFIHKLDNLAGHIQYLPRFLRHMSRHKTLFETRL